MWIKSHFTKFKLDSALKILYCTHGEIFDTYVASVDLLSKCYHQSPRLINLPLWGLTDQEGQLVYKRVQLCPTVEYKGVQTVLAQFVKGKILAKDHQLIKSL